MNQNCMHEEIKSRLHLGKACNHSFRNVSSLRLLPQEIKNIKFKTYRTNVFVIALYGCHIWSLPLRKEGFREQGAEKHIWD